MVRSKKDTAAETWRLLTAFAMSQFGRTSEILQEMGLTPGHMRALFVLEPGGARPMGACASAIGCDASTATWLIDRLEERGLVERKGTPNDRRVKAVVLTPKGAQLKAKLEEKFYEPPAPLLTLDARSLESVHAALSKIMERSG